MNLSVISTPFQPIKRFAFERPFTAFLSGAILLLTFFFIRQAMTPKIEDTTSTKESAPKEVSVFEIGKDVPTGTVVGTLNREHVSTIVATASGVIDTISIREGSVVSKEMPLVHIAPSAASTARALAEADLATTEKNRATEEKILELNKRISEAETTSGRKEDLARENKKLGRENLDFKRIATQLNVEIAKANERSFTPFAPFGGRVEALFVSVGDTVTPGTPIAIVVGSMPRSLIRVEVPSSIAPFIDPKGNHVITLPSGRTAPITLSHISTSALTTHAFQATFSLPDTEATLLGDMTVLQITLALKNTSNVMLIPLSSIETTRETTSVLVDRDGKAKRIPITTAESLGNFIEVAGGLSHGDRIILDRSIRPGDSITIQK